MGGARERSRSHGAGNGHEGGEELQWTRREKLQKSGQPCPAYVEMSISWVTFELYCFKYFKILSQPKPNITPGEEEFYTQDSSTRNAWKAGTGFHCEVIAFGVWLPGCVTLSRRFRTRKKLCIVSLTRSVTSSAMVNKVGNLILKEPSTKRWIVVKGRRASHRRDWD